MRRSETGRYGPDGSAGIAAAVGGTPLVGLRGTEAGGARLAVKLEGCNPGGSIKDRAALFMIRDAEERGALAPGAMIVEPTSGNTGIGLSMIAGQAGYGVTVTMPDSMSAERRDVLASLGARVVLTPAAAGMRGAMVRAADIVRSTPGAWMPGQFGNPSNAEAHYRTTGPEIWEQSEGRIGTLVCGVGTGGTITGAGRFLKERDRSIRVIAVEPAASPVLGGGAAGAHSIEGIGAGFVPELLDLGVVDEVIAVTGVEAFEGARLLASRHGVFAGISSGAASAAAKRLAGTGACSRGLTVIVCPDRGDRYLSAGLWEVRT